MFLELNSEPKATTGICCIKSFSRGYNPLDWHTKGMRIGKGFKRNIKGAVVVLRVG
jgi:hypothetical protein